MSLVGIDIDLDACLGDLSVADKQLVAICRALLHDARLLIMDEPTTALTKKEVASLFKIVRELQAKGISILFVSHKLEEDVYKRQAYTAHYKTYKRRIGKDSRIEKY